MHSYTVPKKEASPFNREVGSKVSQSALKIAVDKALLFMTHDELPPHWDRDLLFGMDVSEDDSDRDGSDSDVSVILFHEVCEVKGKAAQESVNNETSSVFL